jgi:3-hydroxyisobutyrate dehydrogenase-like beta-hydroxyacid dehydrogenase
MSDFRSEGGMQNLQIAVIGAGRMGSALVKAFLNQGHETSVWNRTASKLAPLESIGARIQPSIGKAVAAADIVVVNVRDYEAADGLLRSPEAIGQLRGKLLVQLTSGSPRQARETSAWASEHGIRYLDGAIMATPDLIGGPDTTILYAGNAAVFEQYRPVLLALGANAAHVGEDAGRASALDSALLVVLWGTMFSALYGAAICQAERIDLREYERYLAGVLAPMNSWTLDAVKRIHEGRLASDKETVATVATHYTAFRCLMELCKERNIHPALPDALNPFFMAALEKGHAEDDFAALSQFVAPGGW